MHMRFMIAWMSRQRCASFRGNSDGIWDVKSLRWGIPNFLALISVVGNTTCRDYGVIFYHFVQAIQCFSVKELMIDLTLIVYPSPFRLF